MSQPDYSLRDVVNNMLIPRLDRQDRQIERKLDKEDFEELKRELIALRAQTLDTDDIKRIFTEAVTESSARGWTKVQRWIGIVTVSVIMLTFVLTLVDRLTVHG